MNITMEKYRAEKNTCT